jgi:hypothetical protein
VLERIALLDQGGFTWPPATAPNRSPFPGLMVFEAEDASVFFGRNNDWRVGFHSGLWDPTAWS